MPERERGDWHADAEGNLSAPGELRTDTDEFGRDDPDTLERERRRRERQQQRQSGRKKKAAKQPRAARSPRRRKRAGAGAGSGSRSMGDRAAAGRDAMREHMARHRRDRASAPPGTYRRRRIAALVLAAAAVLLAWFLVAFFQPLAGDGKGSGTVSVEIPEGASAGEIAEILDRQGVVSSARLFEWRLKLAGKSDEIQADTYTLASGMSYGAAIDQLTGEAASGAITVTIPEGLSRDQIASDVLPEGVSSDEYLELTKQAPKGFDPAAYGASKGASLEGFLFPATYELDEGQGVPDLVQQQLAAFKQSIKEVDLKPAAKLNLTAYDVLIVASMIDKEVQVPKERALVASVIYNRLRKGIPLGIDATTRFETKNYTEPITQQQLETDTPYNTRLNAGLPPTPIGNPGLAAIKAAADPASTKFIYFVVKPGTCGEHSFTASEAEFEQLAAEYQQALEAEGGSPTDCG